LFTVIEERQRAGGSYAEANSDSCPLPVTCGHTGLRPLLNSCSVVPSQEASESPFDLFLLPSAFSNLYLSPYYLLVLFKNQIGVLYMDVILYSVAGITNMMTKYLPKDRIVKILCN